MTLARRLKPALCRWRFKTVRTVVVEVVLENPQQTLQQDEEITAYQSQLDFGTGKLYLLRVFINTTIDPAVVVTVYRTSQIKKHWRNP